MRAAIGNAGDGPGAGAAPRRSPAGFTLVELMLVVALIAIIAAVATANLLRSKITGNETRAIGLLRSYANAAEQFFINSRRYPARQEAFTASPPFIEDPGFNFVPQGQCSCTHPDEPLAPSYPDNWECHQIVGGYRYIFYLKQWQNDKDGVPPWDTNDPGFEVFAWPDQLNKTGKRSFYIDETGVIRAGFLAAPSGNCRMISTTSLSEAYKNQFRSMPPLDE